MTVEQEIGQAVHTALHDPMMYRQPGEDIFALYTRVALTALQPFCAELEQLRGEQAAVNDALRRAGIEHPLGPAGVADLAAMANGRLEDLQTVTGERDDALLALADLTPPQRDRERAVLDAAANVVRVWRLWETGRGQAGEPIPVRKLADAVDVYALGPAADALSTPDPEDWPEKLLNARVRFWLCPVHPEGRNDEEGRPLQTVEWRGHVACCLVVGCGRTSADAPSTPDSAEPDSLAPAHRAAPDKPGPAETDRRDS